MFQPTRTVVLEPDVSYPLFVTAKCYEPVHSIGRLGSDSLTLILLHSTSFHKETWEPFIEDLFHLVQQSAGRPPISEVWAIECPNHGESALLNEELLLLPEFHNNFTCEKYAIAAHRFLTACPSKGSKVDFSTRNLVGIGHSLGGVAMTILQSVQPRLEFRTVILVEPMLSPDGAHCLNSLRDKLVDRARKRRDTWDSPQDAFKAFSRRRTTTWDYRTIQAFAKHAIRPKGGCFVLSCTRSQEVGMYQEKEGPVKASCILNDACRRLPIHIMYGSVKDSSGIPLSVQKAVLDPNSRSFASISEIEGVGHLVPQEKPRELAIVIHRILSNDVRNAEVKPKL